MPPIRLQKTISGSGLLSRRKADLLRRQGIVDLNGRQAHIGYKADPNFDHILVDRKNPTKTLNNKVLLLNKPHKVISTCQDNNTLLKIILKEERNRRIQRIANLLQDLQSITISSIKLNGLKEVKWRAFRTNEWISLLD
tara:strand:+ start:918 stop:1334 length:417 start_codon:yes stop_codon:yes gene_type:complete